jgi:hypothetical protein
VGFQAGEFSPAYFFVFSVHGTLNAAKKMAAYCGHFLVC